MYEYGVGSRVVRIVLVCADRHLPHRGTFATLIERSSGQAPNVAVPITHPLPGHIDVTRLRPLDPSAVRARLGRLTTTDMRAVDQALRTYLDL